MTEIYLSEIMTDLHPYEEYKMHFAKLDDNGNEPLDVYMRNFEEWKSWNEWSNGKNDFNRKYIFSLINFYPESDTWLFGGIWKILERNFDKNEKYPYKIKLCDSYKNLIGRLKIKYAHKDRNIRNLMETYFPELVLKEILEEPYTIKEFPGYKNLDVPFETLEVIIKNDNQSWKNALSLRGIYLITDINTGKRYVGKASGQDGIWQRWSDYIADGHGGDVGLIRLLKNSGGLDYAKKYYKFTLLEIVESNLEDDIDARESYWKRVLLTRDPKFGYNKN